jgi:hypothetical protein
LGTSKIARAQQYDDAVTRTFQHRHFAECCDIIDPGIGAGVGGKDHSLIKQDAYAVCHLFSPCLLANGDGAPVAGLLSMTMVPWCRPPEAGQFQGLATADTTVHLQVDGQIA